MKNFKKINWNTILLCVLIAIVIIDIITRSVLLNRSRLELEEMRAQVDYLQDTIEIVQTDVDNLDSDITASLEQENSMLESWSITPCSADFEEDTYDLSVVLTPKSYTDTTKVSIFFGSREFPLALDGHTYVGTVTLSLGQNYDSNVTVLMADGSKKTTEVLGSYTGIQTQVKNVLSGSIDRTPTYKDGLLDVETSVHFALNSNTCFSFDNLLYVVQIDGKDAYCYDLIDEEELAKEMVDGEDTYVVDHNKSYHLASESGETDTSYTGNVEENQEIRLVLRATTNNGFAFEYELFDGYTDLDDDGFAASFSLYASHYEILDPQGGVWYIY